MSQVTPLYTLDKLATSESIPQGIAYNIKARPNDDILVFAANASFQGDNDPAALVRFYVQTVDGRPSFYRLIGGFHQGEWGPLDYFAEKALVYFAKMAPAKS